MQPKGPPVIGYSPRLGNFEGNSVGISTEPAAGRLVPLDAAHSWRTPATAPGFFFWPSLCWNKWPRRSSWARADAACPPVGGTGQPRIMILGDTRLLGDPAICSLRLSR